jgi:hypothetical protein
MNMPMFPFWIQTRNSRSKWRTNIVRRINLVQDVHQKGRWMEVEVIIEIDVAAEERKYWLLRFFYNCAQCEK